MTKLKFKYKIFSTADVRIPAHLDNVSFRKLIVNGLEKRLRGERLIAKIMRDARRHDLRIFERLIDRFIEESDVETARGLKQFMPGEESEAFQRLKRDIIALLGTGQIWSSAQDRVLRELLIISNDELDTVATFLNTQNIVSSSIQARVVQLWGDYFTGFTNNTRNYLVEQLTRQLQSGQQLIAPDFRKDIIQRYNSRDHHVDTLAITTSNNVSGITRTEAYREMGIKYRQWLNVGDSMVRADHRIQNGEIRGLDENFTDGSAYGGAKFRCRCSDIPINEDEITIGENGEIMLDEDSIINLA